jgi:hypothetical protein
MQVLQDATSFYLVMEYCNGETAAATAVATTAPAAAANIDGSLPAAPAGTVHLLAMPTGDLRSCWLS